MFMCYLKTCKILVMNVVDVPDKWTLFMNSFEKTSEFCCKKIS